MPVRRPVCLVCLAFLFIIYVATKGKTPESPWDTDIMSERTVTVSGRVCDIEEKNGVVNIYLRNVLFSEGNSLHTSDADSRDSFPERSKGIVVKPADATDAGPVRIGSIIEAKGVFMPFERKRCEGMFDARSYYMIKGYEGQLKRARILAVSKKYYRLYDGLRKLRDRAYSILKENMSENDAALTAAMTLGDRSDLDPQIKDIYQTAGISHVLALSGLHIASVGLAILKLLKKTGLNERAAHLTAFAIIAAYAVMTGLSTSTQRAMIMFALLALSRVIGRTYDILSAASFSALIMLVKNPLLLYDTGFLFSFGAVLAIACMFPVLLDLPRSFFEKPPRFFEGRVYQSLCISISVTLITLPASAGSYMQLAVYAPVVNLVVIPLMGVVLLTAFSGMITGLTGLNPCFILKITHYILLIFEHLGKFSEKIRGNIQIIGQPSKWQIITYGIICILSVFMRESVKYKITLRTLFSKIIDQTGRPDKKDNDSNLNFSTHKITYNIEKLGERYANRRKKMLRGAFTVFLIAFSVAVLVFHPKRDIEIRCVDVGQGDCTLIWGKDIPVVMIDAGSSDIRQVGRYRVVPVLKANGIRCVEYCFLTHMDSDHVNAVIEMLEDETCPVSIKRIVVSAVTAKRPDPSENWLRLVFAAQNKGIPIFEITDEDTVYAGSLRLSCLSPGKEGVKNMERSSVTTDENDCSTVLLAEQKDAPGAGFSALFTGDIGENVEKAISGRLKDVVYLKCAHHGSRFGTSENFLDITRPELCVISAGVNNSYSHPHKETLKRLYSAGTKVLCTNEYGEIITYIDEGMINVKTLLKRK